MSAPFDSHPPELWCRQTPAPASCERSHINAVAPASATGSPITIFPNLSSTTLTGGSTPIVYTRFADGALPLYDLGWAPIPLAPGEKKPVARWKGWNTVRPSREQIIRLMRSFPEIAIGIAVPDTVFNVDSDILDQLVQAKVLKQAIATLGRPLMVRIGRSPKIMLFYGCASGALRSRKLHPIELFSGTGQVVVGGIHHTTRQPYIWSRVTPWITPPSAITPAVTQDQVNAFLTAIEPAISGMKQKMARSYGSSQAHELDVDVLVRRKRVSANAWARGQSSTRMKALSAMV